MPTAKAVPGKTLLSSTDYPLVDCQAQMAFATKSIDGVVLCHNAVHWRKRADAFRYNCIAMAAAARTTALRHKQSFIDRMLWNVDRINVCMCGRLPPFPRGLLPRPRYRLGNGKFGCYQLSRGWIRGDAFDAQGIGASKRR